jgi:hypothetical protein
MRDQGRIVFDDAKRKEYAGRFTDGAPGTWDTSYHSNAWHVKLPNGANVSLPSPIAARFWDIEFASDVNSSNLWLRSLKYLVNYERSGHHAWNDIEGTLRSFNEWMDGFSDRRDELRSGSLDHQIALRLRTACVLSCLMAREDPDIRTQRRVMSAITERVRSDVVLASELDLFEDNNHGIMLAIAMLHASEFFPDVVDAVAAREWLDKLQDALGRIVDQDGLAPENTISYQIFYVNLLEQLSEFVQWADWDEEKTSWIVSLTRAAVLATRRLVMPDGAVPPIGDSPGGKQSRFGHLPGRVYSPSNGFFVDSDGETYLSMKSGFRSVIHKQMDDGSVILWRDGVFAIRDAGLLSYDQNDARAVAIRGQRGHSSTVLRRFDAMNAMRMVGFSTSTSRMDGELALGENAADEIDVISVTSYDGDPYLRRRVRSSDRRRFTIDDSYLADSRESVLTRLLLDESAQSVSKEGLVVTVVAGPLKITYDLSFNEWLQESAVSLVDGIVAASAYKAVANKVLLIDWGEADDERSLRTVVTIGR